RRFVPVSTEPVLLAGQPLVEADERAPLRFDSPALYPATKARAEEAAVAAAHDGFDVVLVRPRMVWGRGDTTILPVIAELVRAGRFAWIGGGRHLTSTTHVDNVVHGLLLGAEKGMSGGVYFVTDGHPLVFRDFVTRLLATQGLEPPDRGVPYPVATTGAPGRSRTSRAGGARPAWPGDVLRSGRDRADRRFVQPPPRRGRPGDRRGPAPRARAPAAHAGDDRLGELRPTGDPRVPGQRADEQVRRGLPGQALLRRLRVRRHRGAARDRPREGDLRRRACERAAARWRAGERRGLPRAPPARRHDHGTRPAARRAPDPRDEDQRLR